MRKILVAIDGSDTAIHAAGKARELADALGAELTLAYVVPPYARPIQPLGPVEELDEADATRGRRMLDDAAQAIGGEVKKLVLGGPVAQMLAEQAEADDVEIVVVGSNGTGAVTRLFLGSVSSRLAHVCKRSVLVVR
jgi:nucleotide-binding universal stress UspA family protein